MITFGTGRLIATTTSGLPVELGILQNIDINFSFDKKELHGQNQFARAVARGKGKIDGKASYAELRADAINLVFGGTVNDGRQRYGVETFTIGADSKVVATKQASAVIVDKGAFDVSNPSIAIPMKKVTTAPVAINEYKVDVVTGTYTFYTGTTGKRVQINYAFEGTDGKTIKLTNALMGAAPIFTVELDNNYNNTGLGVKLFACTSNKLDLSFKQEDFVIPGFEFSAMADAAGDVGEIYIDE